MHELAISQAADGCWNLSFLTILQAGNFSALESLAIFGNSRRVLKVKGLISRLETHKIESERANSMFVNTVWVTSIYIYMVTVFEG